MHAHGDRIPSVSRVLPQCVFCPQCWSQEERFGPLALQPLILSPEPAPLSFMHLLTHATGILGGALSARLQW